MLHLKWFKVAIVMVLTCGQICNKNVIFNLYLLTLVVLVVNNIFYLQKKFQLSLSLPITNCS